MAARQVGVGLGHPAELAERSADDRIGVEERNGIVRGKSWGPAEEHRSSCQAQGATKVANEKETKARAPQRSTRAVRRADGKD
eukprot:1992096-Amphidinium_carterae.1